MPGLPTLPGSVGAARRRRERQASGFQSLGDFGGERDTFCRSSRIVDQNSAFARPFGRIENQSRADFADRCRAVAFVAGKLKDCRFVEVITGEMFIDVAEHDVAFEKRRKARARARHFKPSINGV